MLINRQVVRKEGDSNPPIPFRGIHAFQACLFNHSSTFPYEADAKVSLFHLFPLCRFTI